MEETSDEEKTKLKQKYREKKYREKKYREKKSAANKAAAKARFEKQQVLCERIEEDGGTMYLQAGQR